MKSLFLCLLLVAAVFTACDKDETTVVDQTLDGGNVSGIWEKGSTITVKGHLVIPEGKSLTIEEGVTVLMNDPSIGQEILVYGSLYCKGTAAKPILFTVPESSKIGDFPRVWGGILCGPTAKELLMDYTHIEYTGFVTTEESPSVKAGFFKAAAGEGLPAVNFKNNVDGKVVIMNSTFNNLGEDCFYLEGGNIIIANNKIYTQGETGGDAINMKAGCIADVAFNLVYAPNTNALKLSNSGDRTPQCHVVGYNNTIVNAGWRRPTVKGGGIWLEAGVYAEIWNNLQVNCRFAVKNNAKEPGDVRSTYDYSYYYAHTQEGVDSYLPTVKDVVRGAHDIASATPGDKNPLFENYALATDPNNPTFNTSWDFHLKTGSPALTGAKTNFARNYSTTGITINGVVYKSPAPAAYFGAMGTK
ncbi:MAG: right-handed parallel beta-helix repeat-containing protein [Bacteroidota bacterium]|nr:right-handed parallel beta-helix repeat-containing protein [Bacteroidota bacterium]